MRTSPSQKRGFSLVEVALSLFIIAIAVVSLIGMLGVALDSDRTAGRDTVLVAMSSQVLNRLRAVPFDALWLADPSATPNPPVPSAADVPSETTYYFSDDGTLLANSAASVPPETVFRCIVQKQPDESSRSGPGKPCNRVTLKLRFSWPVSSETGAAEPNLQILHASIAKY